jgi:hypothetical protein
MGRRAAGTPSARPHPEPVLGHHAVSVKAPNLARSGSTSGLRQLADKQKRSLSGRFSLQLCTFAPRYGFADLCKSSVFMIRISAEFETRSLEH